MEIVWWSVGIVMGLGALAVLGNLVLGLLDAMFGRDGKDYYDAWDLDDEDF